MLKNMTAKLGILKLTQKAIDNAMQKSEKNIILERKVSFSETKVNEIHELKLKIQEEKLLQGDELDIS